MPLLRLIGLALFITAIFLSLAAAITKTTHLRIQLPGTSNALQPSGSSVPNGSMVFPPPAEPRFGNEYSQAESTAIQYTLVPIVWPLVIAAGSGLLMWFMLSSDTPRTSNRGKQQSGRRRY